MIYQSLDIELSNTDNNNSCFISFNIEPNGLAQKWAEKLCHLLKNEVHLEKNFLFHGWFKGERNLEYLCHDLNRHISIINQSQLNANGTVYFIDQVFNPLRVTQEDLNLIHHHFEVLIGQVWSMSPYYALANHQTRHSIRQLNNLCHEMEALIKSQEYFENGRCSAHMIFAMLPIERFELENDDYNYFQTDLDFGDVRLHYAQLGKTHLEVFYDHDNEIHHSNISGLRYLTGEFDISFMDTRSRASRERHKEEFNKWLIQKGFNPQDKKLALGFAVVAKLDRTQFVDFTNRDILEKLFQYNDVSSLSVHSSHGTVKKRFPYRWNDNGMDQLQVQLAARETARRKPRLFNFMNKLFRVLPNSQ